MPATVPAITTAQRDANRHNAIIFVAVAGIFIGLLALIAWAVDYRSEPAIGIAYDQDAGDFEFTNLTDQRVHIVTDMFREDVGRDGTNGRFESFWLEPKGRKRSHFDPRPLFTWVHASVLGGESYAPTFSDLRITDSGAKPGNIPMGPLNEVEKVEYHNIRLG